MLTELKLSTREELRVRFYLGKKFYTSWEYFMINTVTKIESLKGTEYVVRYYTRGKQTEITISKEEFENILIKDLL